MMGKIKIAGGTFGSQAEVKKAMERTAGGLTWRVPSEGTLTVRFLTEPDAWRAFSEVYNEQEKTFRPLLEGERSDARPSKRILANVLLRDTGSGGGDRVVPLKMAMDLAKRVNNRFERVGTILDRDYTLGRSGSGFDTTYDVDSEAPERIKNLAKYELLDLDEVLVKEYEAALAGDVGGTSSIDTDVEDEDDDEEVEDEEVEDDEDDDGAEDADEEEDDDEPADDDEDEDAEDGDAEEVTYEALQKMGIPALKEWAAELEVDIPAGTKKSQLVDLVWDAL